MGVNRQKKYDNPFIATFTGIRDLFRRYEAAGELKPSDRLDGKTVLVDGASSGLGFAIATDAAKRGARVFQQVARTARVRAIHFTSVLSGHFKCFNQMFRELSP